MYLKSLEFNWINSIIIITLKTDYENTFLNIRFLLHQMHATPK